MHSASAHPTEPLPPYLVVELERGPAVSAGHDHVVAVVTRDPDGGETRWTTVGVISAIRDGERFVLAEDDRGGETLVEPAICPACPTVTLVVPDGS